MQEQFFWRLSHICESSGRGVTVISVSMVNKASHSIQSQRRTVSHSYRSHLAHFVAVILGTPLWTRNDMKKGSLICRFLMPYSFSFYFKYRRLNLAVPA